MLLERFWLEGREDDRPDNLSGAGRREVLAAVVELGPPEQVLSSPRREETQRFLSRLSDARRGEARR